MLPSPWKLLPRPNSGPFLLFEIWVIVCDSAVPRMGSSAWKEDRQRRERRNGSGDQDTKQAKSDHLLCTRCYIKTCAYTSLGDTPQIICDQDEHDFIVPLLACILLHAIVQHY